MRLHRFLVDQPLTDSVIHVSDKDLVHQWNRVLRYSVGVKVCLLDGKGTQVIGSVAALSSKHADVLVESRETQQTVDEPCLTLYFSPLKREFTELIFQKGTELGVSRFQPILCDRTVRDGFNPERAARILKEATEQSGRVWVPECCAPVSFGEALVQNQADMTFFASLEISERVDVSKKIASDGSLALFIGPEGGWTEEEEHQAKTTGYTPFRLSSHVLRAETACIAGVALLRA